MTKCPHCGNTVNFSADNKKIGSWGYSVKVISCFSCKAIVGTTLSDEMQEMIETIYRKLN